MLLLFSANASFDHRHYHHLHHHHQVVLTESNSLAALGFVIEDRSLKAANKLSPKPENKSLQPQRPNLKLALQGPGLVLLTFFLVVLKASLLTEPHKQKLSKASSCFGVFLTRCHLQHEMPSKHSRDVLNLPKTKRRSMRQLQPGAVFAPFPNIQSKIRHTNKLLVHFQATCSCTKRCCQHMELLHNPTRSECRLAHTPRRVACFRTVRPGLSNTS